MLINYDEANCGTVRFVRYDGKWPSLCSGTLILNVSGKDYTWEKHSGLLSSGGGLEPNYSGTYSGEWLVDYSKIPDDIKRYAAEIDHCINENIEYGCCGGCI